MNHKLLLARLFEKDGAAVLESRVRKDLEPIFTRANGGAKAERAVERNVERALDAGLVVRQVNRGRARLQLTDAGRARARGWFPEASRMSWATLKKTWLTAHALGLDTLLAPAAARELSKLSRLRVVLISQHLGLELPALPDAKAFDRALLWHAMRAGLSDPVYSWAKRRSPTLSVVAAALAASLSGVAPSAKKAEVYARYAANLAGARNAGELHVALLSRLVEPAEQAAEQLEAAHQSEGNGASGAEPTPTAALEDGALASAGFAARVLASARRSSSGKLDGSLILINHVYDQYLRDNPAEQLSLAQFKQQLMSRALDGELVLAAADMPQTLDPSDYRASRIERGASVYALLRM